ncbi:MAG TPA: HAD hydrolase-like protein [Patescibacteria group bacterium]|nr:HAD hydrolase-like protein [Patescibacteria group bacterium]
MVEKKFLLLDLDGTIINTVLLWRFACKQILEQDGFYLTDSQIALLPNELHSVVQYGHRDSNEFVRRVVQYVRENVSTTQLHVGVLEILELFKSRGLPMAIVTSSFHITAMEMLEQHCITGYFPVVVGRDDVADGHTKPHREPFDTALTRLGGIESKKKVVVTGDQRNDVLGGKNIGAITVAYYPEAHHSVYQSQDVAVWGADHVISDFSELEHIVLRQ